MKPSELEEKATLKARTVDPTILPESLNTTTPNDWRTWVSPAGQWIFIEKSVIAAMAAAFAFDKEQAFQWIGQHMLEWLSKNSARLKPRDVWNIKFHDREDTPVQFGIWQNQCFVFMPRGVK